MSNYQKVASTVDECVALSLQPREKDKEGYSFISNALISLLNASSFSGLTV